MTRCIYKIINVVNNKFYVGSAVNFDKRKARHIWRLKRGDHANKHLQAAWNMYGERAFVFAIVQEIEESQDLLKAENVWLKEHVGKEYCYNIARDATAPQLGMSGEKSTMWGKRFNHTEEAKAKIAAASKARVQTKEEKEKRKQTMKGHTVATSTRIKISAALTGEGNYWYGKKRPEFAEKVRKPVVVTEPNGKTTTYPSISAVREALQLKPPTVNRALKSGAAIKRGKLAGWRIEYLLANEDKHE